LSLADRNMLVFGTIFVEHILCKVSRFEYLIGHKKKLSLYSISMKAAESVVWPSTPEEVRGGMALPIQVRGDCVKLEASVRQWA
jgi:hypothetical protein